ncbi:hypothetical protein [Microbispora sp. NPDC046933]|uniref:hypothetical protein n=1 Tax=Microbispora sp. NPDC046933 TaxID=3155618 RepID=UPI0033CC35F9
MIVPPEKRKVGSSTLSLTARSEQQERPERIVVRGFFIYGDGNPFRLRGPEHWRHAGAVDLGVISLVVTIVIGVAQAYLAWLQLRHSRNQATPQQAGPAENASPPPATSAEPTPSPGPAPPPHDAPAETPPAALRQRRAPESHPRPDPQVEEVGESCPSPPADTPVEDTRGIIPVLLAYIPPAVGGLVSLSALGWIFGYDDLAKGVTTPTDRAQLSVSLWFIAAAILVSSASTGFKAYTWFREKSISDDTNEVRFNLYVAMAVLGPPLAVWLVIARRAVML